MTTPADVTTTREVPDEMRPIGEVHAKLIAQAEANAKANADAHAAQVAENNKFQTLLASNPAPMTSSAPSSPEPDPAKPAAKPAPANQAQAPQK